MDFVTALENEMKIKAVKHYLPLQDGDVISTMADVSELEEKINYKPDTPLAEGVHSFINWFFRHYGNKQNKIM